MPTFSAINSAPYPIDTSFRPVPTIEVNPPDYGFHFRLPVDARGQTAFDNCESYPQIYGDGASYSRYHILLRYELLFQHQTGHLQSQYYVVPWIWMPATLNSPTTINLLVSPLSIYDAAITKAVKKDLKQKISSSTRVIELISPTAPTIQVFWGKSGTNTTIDESDLKDETPVRIVIPPGVYQGIKFIQIQSGSTILGKARLSFSNPQNQLVCFLKIDELSANNTFKAKLLNPLDVPKSFENGTRLDTAAATAFKTYGIKLETIENGELLDAQNNVLVSTQTELEFDSTLKPADNLTFHRKALWVDDKVLEKLLSKVAAFKHIVNGTPKVEPFHRLLIAILMPFHFDSNETGFTIYPPSLNNGVLNAGLHSYILPMGKYWQEHYKTNQATLWRDVKSVIKIEPVANIYDNSTVIHEFLHALLLRHTFLNDAEPIDQALKEYREYVNGKKLTEFGAVETDETIPLLFNLIREMDLKTALIDEYLLKTLKENPTDLSAPFFKGLIMMRKLNHHLIFNKESTKNMMDYFKNEVTAQGTMGFDNILRVDVLWAGTDKKILFKYQWELARAMVAFLASY